MNEKDFVELAEQLAILRRELIWYPLSRSASAVDVWRKCVSAVVLACQATSANFDAVRFRAACEK